MVTLLFEASVPNFMHGLVHGQRGRGINRPSVVVLRASSPGPVAYTAPDRSARTPNETGHDQKGVPTTRPLEGTRQTKELEQIKRRGMRGPTPHAPTFFYTFVTFTSSCLGGHSDCVPTSIVHCPGPCRRCARCCWRCLPKVTAWPQTNGYKLEPISNTTGVCTLV